MNEFNEYVRECFSVAGDIVIRDEFRESCFAATFRNLVCGFVRAHESRSDV